MSRPLTFAAVLAGVLWLPACTGGEKHSGYNKRAVSPVRLSRPAENQLKIQYAAPAETLFYSPGVDFAVRGDTLRVTLRRCGIKEACAVMAKAAMPAAEAGTMEVTVPYGGRRVVVLYADGEEQLSP